jgi:8-oxo-dGTP pyrophosphatase MutT (NUDIX family)
VDSRQVAAALRRFERRGVDRPDLKRSAVGIALVPDPDGLVFLLTRRAATLRGHPGQWALPGGRAEPGETARRELDEELGLGLGPDARARPQPRRGWRAAPRFLTIPDSNRPVGGDHCWRNPAQVQTCRRWHPSRSRQGRQR